MLAMVEVERRGGHDGSERILIVGQVGQNEWHGGRSLASGISLRVGPLRRRKPAEGPAPVRSDGSTRRANPYPALPELMPLHGVTQLIIGQLQRGGRCA